MRTTIKGSLTWLCLLSFYFFYGQQRNISGTVSSTDGNPLPGVNILVKGSTQGTQSDFDGRYTIQVDEIQ